MSVKAVLDLITVASIRKVQRERSCGVYEAKRHVYRTCVAAAANEIKTLEDARLVIIAMQELLA